MGDCYQPAASPASLSGFALHVLAQKRVVGTAVRKHVALGAHGVTGTDGEAALSVCVCCACVPSAPNGAVRAGAEASRVGRHVRQLDMIPTNEHLASRCYTDVTRSRALPSGVPAEHGKARGVQASEDAKEKLAWLRQESAASRTLARESRQRVPRCLAPGEDALQAARKTVQLARAAREQAASHKHQEMQRMLNAAHIY